MAANNFAQIPLAFELIDFPPGLWPHDGKQAVDKNGKPAVHAAVRWLVLANRDSLTKAGALVRPGRTLVILGPQYLGWLQRQAERVAGFEIAPNVKSSASKAAALDAA